MVAVREGKRPILGMVIAAVVAGMLVVAGLPAYAEPRTLASAHFGPTGFGLDLERELGAGSGWLVGISLDPVGVYAGVRQYTTSAPVHRPFYGAYMGMRAHSAQAELHEFHPGLWVGGGYEIRFDPRVRGTGELGFGLVEAAGRIRSHVFIGLALGLKL